MERREETAIFAFRNARSAIAALVATASLLGVAGLSPASAATNGYQRGPAPTTANLTAALGSYAVSTLTVPASSVTGFGGGTIYYPTSTADGKFGAVAISPGFLAGQGAMAWLGPRLASRGFVVFTIDTLGLLDAPADRGDELLKALLYLVTKSSVASRVDSARLAVMGHSMGGGGALEASSEYPSVRAAIAMTPWDTTTDWSSLRTPTLIFGAQDDTSAPVATYAKPIYQSLGSSYKMYVELKGAAHTAPMSANTTIAEYSIDWLKIFLDADYRYLSFLCPTPTGSGISASVSTCPA